MSNAVKNCFVVMGFGIKTDLATGRKLNLDKSYLALIKPVVEGRGMTCVRADEIRHSGTIDLPMFQQLLSSDLVIADLSTANVNAFYELGIRHALRPKSTIIISEEQLCYPFDINHIQINRYKHLGDSIDYFEVLNFQKILGETIDAIVAKAEPDSPVYTFLNELMPPSLKKQAKKVAGQIGAALASKQDEEGNAPQGEETQTLALLVRQAEDALRQKQYMLAKSLFHSALVLSSCKPEQMVSSNNNYLIHRLALATYKTGLPDEVTALQEAIGLLQKIDLAHTNDAETVSLAGAIEKRLYEIGQGEQHIENAILYYLRGFFLLHNRYNGINLAYLLNCRAQATLTPSKEEKIADMVWANRIRRDVLEMCAKELRQLQERAAQGMREEMVADNQGLAIVQGMETEQQFWIWANKAEAHFGLGEMEAYKAARKEAEATPHENWMMEAFNTQVQALDNLLKKPIPAVSFGSLLPELTG